VLDAVKRRTIIGLKENHDSAIAPPNELIVGVRDAEAPLLWDEFPDSPAGTEPGQCAAQDAPVQRQTSRSIEGFVQLLTCGW